MRDAVSEEESSLKVQYTLDVMQHDFHQENKEDSLVMMLIALSSSSRDSKYTCCALLLQLVDPAGEVYRRIGVGSWSISESDRAQREGVFRRDDVGAEADYYCAEYRDGLYSIDIV